MLDAMNQINTPRAAPDSSWLLKARGNKSQRNAPSLLCCAHSAQELQGHWANHHHENIISIPLTRDSILYYSALLICLSSLLWFSSLREILYQNWAFWVSKPARMPFVLGHVSITSWTPNNSIHSCLPSSFHLLRVTFAVSFCDMLGQGWVWPFSGLSQTCEGRVWIRTPQGIANTAGLFIRKANPKNWKRGRGDFFFPLALLFSQIFPTTFTNASRLAFGEGQRLSSCLRGKDFVVHVV